MTLRVLLVEDSPTQAQALARMLEAEGDLAVVATARGGEDAVAEAARHRPDVITMDLDIPQGGGQMAIERIMSESPVPILVLSALLGDHGEAAVRALAAGAVDAMPKPHTWTDRDAADLRRQVRRVGAVPVIRRRARGAPRAAPGSARSTQGPVVAIAASTGGPAALATVLAGLDGVRAPILVVQHIHPSFTAGFAEWLGRATGRGVSLAEHGHTVRAGCVYVAPGERHLRLGPRHRLILTDEPRSLHRPSADVLFHSLAEQVGPAAVGVLLTGMGEDGAGGLLALREAGGTALAQDQQTSAVFGMPAAAQRAGAAEELVALDRLAGRIREAVEQRC